MSLLSHSQQKKRRITIMGGSVYKSNFKEPEELGIFTPTAKSR